MSAGPPTPSETSEKQAKAAKVASKTYKRASKACLCCRARKVRCDVIQKGTPCTNCHLDDEKCVVTKRASRIAPHLYHRDDIEMSATDPRQVGTCNPILPAGDQPTTAMRPEQSVLQPNGTASFKAQLCADVTYFYYDFLKADNLSSLLPQDVNFLESQGCLRVPTREIMDEILRTYFAHVHPMVPLIDEGDFWDAYDGHAGSPSSKQIPLLLLQAMLLASVDFVSQTTVAALGLKSSSDGRATLHRRTKLLFDFGVEPSEIIQAQTALLLSVSSPTSHAGQSRPESAWLNMAIHKTRSAIVTYQHEASSDDRHIRAHAEYEPALGRLWRCCVTRDRALALTLQIKRQIGEADSLPWETSSRSGSKASTAEYTEGAHSTVPPSLSPDESYAASPVSLDGLLETMGSHYDTSVVSMGGGELLDGFDDQCQDASSSDVMGSGDGLWLGEGTDQLEILEMAHSTKED